VARHRPDPAAPPSAALRGARRVRRPPVVLTEDGGRERALQFRQRLMFGVARTFVGDPKLATDGRNECGSPSKPKRSSI
jgi:hypothetical protein